MRTHTLPTGPILFLAALRFICLLPEGENQRSIFPYAFSKGVHWLFKSPKSSLRISLIPQRVNRIGHS